MTPTARLLLCAAVLVQLLQPQLASAQGPDCSFDGFTYQAGLLSTGSFVTAMLNRPLGELHRACSNSKNCIAFTHQGWLLSSVTFTFEHAFGFLQRGDCKGTWRKNPDAPVIPVNPVIPVIPVNPVVCQFRSLPGFEFTQGRTCDQQRGGRWLMRVWGKTPDGLANDCRSNSRCRGFTSDGDLWFDVPGLVVNPVFVGVCQGIWVKVVVVNPVVNPPVMPNVGGCQFDYLAVQAGYEVFQNCWAMFPELYHAGAPGQGYQAAIKICDNNPRCVGFRSDGVIVVSSFVCGQFNDIRPQCFASYRKKRVGVVRSS